MKLKEVNKNGTSTFLLNDGREIKSYQSGYVRIDNRKSDRLYQINRVTRYKPTNSEYYYYTRVLIPNEIDRLQYIINWVNKNVK